MKIFNLIVLWRSRKVKISKEILPTSRGDIEKFWQLVDQTSRKSLVRSNYWFLWRVRETDSRIVAHLNSTDAAIFNELTEEIFLENKYKEYSPDNKEDIVRQFVDIYASNLGGPSGDRSKKRAKDILFALLRRVPNLDLNLELENILNIVFRNYPESLRPELIARHKEREHDLIQAVIQEIGSLREREDLENIINAEK